jgi:hypothetical protein
LTERRNKCGANRRAKYISVADGTANRLPNDLTKSDGQDCLLAYRLKPLQKNRLTNSDGRHEAT